MTDGSTETFWESGDEDKNKTKSLMISSPAAAAAAAESPRLRVVCVHVDNARDIGNKVSAVTIAAGPTADTVEQVIVIVIATTMFMVLSS